MKLYSTRIPHISAKVIDVLSLDGSVEISPKNRIEASRDLDAVMEEFLRRESDIRREAKDYMSIMNIPYDRFGFERSKICKKRKHPTGNDIEKFLARQFVESFMISNFVEEVYSDDESMYKKIINVLRSFHVDEEEVRATARSKISNITEGTVEYEIALQNAIREVKEKRGLIKN